MRNKALHWGTDSVELWICCKLSQAIQFSYILLGRKMYPSIKFEMVEVTLPQICYLV